MQISKSYSLFLVENLYQWISNIYQYKSLVLVIHLEIPPNSHSISGHNRASFNLYSIFVLQNDCSSTCVNSLAVSRHILALYLWRGQGDASVDFERKFVDSAVSADSYGLSGTTGTGTLRLISN